ncbi:MAG: hypothetical protein WBG94_10880 [Anaerolineales bacterium]
MTKGDYKNAKGVLPWKKGDELSEHIINRFRDGGEDAKPYYYRKWVNAQADADKRLVLLKRCGSALVSLDNAFPNEMDVIDADLLSELAEAIAEE